MKIKIKLVDLDSIAASRPPEWKADVLAVSQVKDSWAEIEASDYHRLWQNHPRISEARPGLGDIIARVATPVARAAKMDCIDPKTNELKPDSGCQKRKEWFNNLGNKLGIGSPRVTLHGGLGDCFLDYYGSGAFDRFEDLGVDDSADVYIFCHNPHAHEIFAWMPRKINVHTCQWSSARDEEKCVREFGGVRHRMTREVPRLPHKLLRFYPSPADRVFLHDLVVRAAGRPIVVLQSTSGMNHRNLPAEIVSQVMANLRSKALVVAVGRNYTRDDRIIEQGAPYGAVDAIDKLSVAGTCDLVKMSAGLICGHSSLNILAWFLRKPQLVLYPEPIGKAHFREVARWSFGMNYPETVRCTFSEFTRQDVWRFIDAARLKG